MRSAPLLVGMSLWWFIGAANAQETHRSPANQVFQFSVSGRNDAWQSETANQSTLNFWIPEKCEQLRGLLILGANVPEHMLVGHPAIREACARNDLGIVWAVPTFWNFSKTAKGHDDLQVAFLERLLKQLAEKSGYSEVATAPWIPIGESGHLLMVGGLLQERPERCIAGICVKNPGPKSREVPVLWTLGTAQEWGQKSVDLRAHWLNTGDYAKWCRERASAREPSSMAIEPGTGHFYCSDKMVELFAAYIDAAVAARLPAEAGQPLRPVNLEQGVVANLPLPGQKDLAVVACREATPEQLRRPWFFNSRLARMAQNLATADWDASPQFVAFAGGEGCRVAPYSLNSVTEIFAEGDGEFHPDAQLLTNVPEGFASAGQPLAQAPGQPVVEWICGPFAPIAGGKFRVALDRTWTGKAAAYVIARHEGGEGIRRTVQPARITLVPNTEGRTQTIEFLPVPDVTAGTPSVLLRASSDAGLPVSFFVDHGPAIIKNETLEILPLPPRTRYPVEVAVTAWQWGRRSDPPVQTATPVTRKFRILKP